MGLLKAVEMKWNQIYRGVFRPLSVLILFLIQEKQTTNLL